MSWRPWLGLLEAQAMAPQAPLWSQLLKRQPPQLPPREPAAMAVVAAVAVMAAQELRQLLPPLPWCQQVLTIPLVLDLLVEAHHRLVGPLVAAAGRCQATAVAWARVSMVMMPRAAFTHR